MKSRYLYKYTVARHCNLTFHLLIQNKLPRANYCKGTKLIGISKDKRTVHLASQHACHLCDQRVISRFYNRNKHVLTWWLVEEGLYRRRHSTGSLGSPTD